MNLVGKMNVNSNHGVVDANDTFSHLKCSSRTPGP